MINDSILNFITEEEQRFFLCNMEMNVWPLDDDMNRRITVDDQGFLEIEPDTEKE